MTTSINCVHSTASSPSPSILLCRLQLHLQLLDGESSCCHPLLPCCCTTSVLSCCRCLLTIFSQHISQFTAFLGCFEISVLLSTVLLSCSFYIFPESHFSSLQFAALCSKNVQRHFTAMFHTLFHRFKILLVHCSELPRCFHISVLFQEYTEVVLSAMQLEI